MDEATSNIRVYQDNINRLLMGEVIEETPDKWVVKNPLILNVQTVNGQISIQFFPIMFKEFLADKDQPTIWEVSRSNITPCQNIVLDTRLVSQYKNIFAPVRSMNPVMNMTPSMQTGLPAQGQPNTNVIKLFDD